LQTSASEQGATCGETSSVKISSLTMTIASPGIELRQTPRGCTAQQSRLLNSRAVTKDHDSDGQVTLPVANPFQFYGCKLLKTLYLFASLDPVNLNTKVSVTEKTRHSSARLSQDRNSSADFAEYTDLFVQLLFNGLCNLRNLWTNLTVVRLGAYKQR